MSEFQTIIKIEAGETTCASEPGKFCQFLGAKSFGAKPVCMFFRDSDGNYEQIFTNKDGWSARTKQCLSTFRPGATP